MPRTKIKPNAQLKQIVLEETNDGRDVVRYLKSTFMDIEGAPELYGLRAQRLRSHPQDSRSPHTRQTRTRRGQTLPQKNLRPDSLQESPPRRRRRPKERHGRVHRATVPHGQERDQRRQGHHHPLRRHNEGLLPRVQAPPAHGGSQRTHPTDRVRLRRRAK